MAHTISHTSSFARRGFASSLGKTLVLGVAAVGVLFGIRAIVGPSGDKPAAFAAGTSLSEAIEQSRKTGKPVFALATADWCPPCKSYKATSLADGGITNRLKNNYIPVMIDVDQSRDQMAQLARAGFQVKSLPTSVVLMNGQAVDARIGPVPTSQLAMWLDTYSP